MLDAEISGCRLRETGCRHQASRGLWGLRGRPVRSGKVVLAGRLLEARAKLPETIAYRMTLSLRRARHPVCVKGGSCDVIPRSRNAHRCVAAIPFRSANLITCTRTILSAERPRSMARPQACYTAGRCRVHCIAWFRSESWIGVRTATPQQDDPTSTPGLRAIRDGSLIRPAQQRASSTWNRATAGSAAPRRLRWLDIASSPSRP